MPAVTDTNACSSGEVQSVLGGRVEVRFVGQSGASLGMHELQQPMIAPQGTAEALFQEGCQARATTFEAEVDRFGIDDVEMYGAAQRIVVAL